MMMCNARINLPFQSKCLNPIPLSSKTPFSKQPMIRFLKASLEKNDGDQFLQASLMVSETVRHYNLWKQGFVENTHWHSSSHKHLVSYRSKEKLPEANTIGLGVLRRFQSPTIFLKIACDRDLLLPIIVGEFDIIQLINALSNDQHEAIPDQFHFAKKIVLKFGFEVKMVKITEPVVNIYHACIYLQKPTDDVNISVDASPSDAINVAEISKAPIYISKEIVLKDAMKIVYGKWRGRGKTVYDVSLDSAVEGHDPLAEEIDTIRRMKIAVLEERYEDAAMCKDKLAKLRMHSHEL